MFIYHYKTLVDVSALSSDPVTYNTCYIYSIHSTESDSVNLAILYEQLSLSPGSNHKIVQSTRTLSSCEICLFTHLVHCILTLVAFHLFLSDIFFNF